LAVPFDFSHGELGIEVNVKGQSLHMLLDTGVDPSVIDLARAEALGLRVDRGNGGGVSGGGAGNPNARAFPATLDGLSIGGRAFHPIDALAFDMTELSAGYGRKLDGVLGFSFLSDKIVLIDYDKHAITLLNHGADAAALTQDCRQHWDAALSTFDSFPVIADFHFGATAAPVTLDTGSNGGIALYQAALEVNGLRAALVHQGQSSFTGANGAGSAERYTLSEPVAVGPFTLPAGQTVTLRSDQGAPGSRVANIGNQVFAAMHVRILLDYLGQHMTFYGDCPA
jgi:hypothetical protein